MQEKRETLENRDTPRMRQLEAKTSLLWLLPDICETLLMELEEEYRRLLGLRMRHEARRDYNTALAALRRLKGEVRKMRRTAQEAYGADSDKVLAILMALTDRCADDEGRMKAVYDYIAAFPSRLGIPLERYAGEFRGTNGGED